jgi:hypothetical protein
METLSNILVAILFLSPIWLIIALIKPNLFKLKSRWRVAGIYPAIVVVLFVFIGFAVPEKTPEQIAAEKAQIEQQEKELAEKERLAKIEQAKIAEKNHIDSLLSTSISSYNSKTREQRMEFLKEMVKYSNKMPKQEAGTIAAVREKYGELNETDLNFIYNALSKRIALFPLDFNLRTLNQAMLTVFFVFNHDKNDRVKRDFDAVIESQYLITYQMEEFVKSHMNDPDSFKFVRIDKKLNGNYVTFIMTYRGRNGFNAVVTEQFPVNVSIATGEVVI